MGPDHFGWTEEQTKAEMCHTFNGDGDVTRPNGGHILARLDY